LKTEHNPSYHHTIASYFARTHVKNAHNLGADTRFVLAGAGLSYAVIEQEKRRITPDQLASIVKRCWLATGDEFLGLTEQTMKLGMFALLAERLIQCKTLGDVLIYAAKFYRLCGDQLLLTIEKQGGRVFCYLEPNFTQKRKDTTPQSLLTELLLLIFHRFSSWLVAEFIALNKVAVTHTKPEHFQEYRLMFPCRCEFMSEKNALVFDSEYLQLPVIRNKEALDKYLKESPLQWFKKQSYYDTYSAKVIRILESAKSDRETQLDSVASTLNMTERTLRRKLVAEGSKFQQLKDNMRRDRAINLFKQGSLTIAQIGLAVGFTELATFSRAFKQWTGVSPSTYRNYR
jgi:AraC-like DNA-binding protein